jgi:hypothetical protein
MSKTANKSTHRSQQLLELRAPDKLAEGRDFP